MIDADRLARNRYFLMMGANCVGVAGAVLALLILGRATTTEQTMLGIALMLAAFWVMAAIPRMLARRWRTPPEA
ncbi:hypothetical protein CA233_07255 [Sphingomonas sp. ABOLD]|uniref:Uncharacterized membrane protein YhaH (DUF805 family) n=1 Tax=Sphingomonas trueperi TaxID=53317 RepID=A0A7X5XW58_9SPHN|nr:MULTISPECIES: hypothetical protein [unclassified Sphingomonas]NJB96473.1 uncharacterized membrane protein YhaH (DUF805 family) [Sphingomonas trueperi]RSV39803.1 hypothetical protein CA234_13575 [Sphingomonas sp. ABOLE]RSV50200.1 hypothetical protein CA233_07255 [Sphingomonas sp. ABOLD]